MIEKEDILFTAIGMLKFLRNDIEHNLSESQYLICLINHIIKVLERLE